MDYIYLFVYASYSLYYLLSQNVEKIKQALGMQICT